MKLNFEAFLDCLKRLQDHRSLFEETVSKKPRLLKAFNDLLDEEPNTDNTVLVSSNYYDGTTGFFFDTRYGLIHAHYQRAFRGGKPGFRVDCFGNHFGMTFIPADFKRKPGYEGIDLGLLVRWRVSALWLANERKPDIPKGQPQYRPEWVKKGFTIGHAKILFSQLRMRFEHFESLVDRHIKCTNRNLMLALQTLYGYKSVPSYEPTPDINQNYLKDKNESGATPASNTSVTWKVTRAVLDMSNVLEPEYNPLVTDSGILNLGHETSPNTTPVNGTTVKIDPLVAKFGTLKLHESPESPWKFDTGSSGGLTLPRVKLATVSTKQSEGLTFGATATDKAFGLIPKENFHMKLSGTNSASESIEKQLALEDYKIAAAALTASIGSEGCRFSVGAKAHEFKNIRQCPIRAYNYAYRFRTLSAHKRRRMLAHTTTSPEEDKPVSNVIFHFGNDLELFSSFPFIENNGPRSIGDIAADLQKELGIRGLNFQPQEYPSSTTSEGYDFGNAASTPTFLFSGNKDQMRFGSIATTPAFCIGAKGSVKAKSDTSSAKSLNLAASGLVGAFRALAAFPGSRGARSALEEEGKLPKPTT